MNTQPNQNCNIIRDMLPLYAEEICSEDTRRFVEEHLGRCSECRNTCQLLKNTELSADATEQKQIHALKKLDRHVFGKIWVSYLLSLAAITAGVLILLFIMSKISAAAVFFPTATYFLMPLAMLATGISLHHKDFARQRSRLWNILSAAQGILILYSGALMLYTTHTLQSGGYPFGLVLHRTGPFLAAQFNIIITVSLVFLVLYLYQSGRKKMSNSMFANMAIFCIFLTLTYHSMLYQMASFETLYRQFILTTLILSAIGIATALAIWLIRKIEMKKA